MPLRPGMIEAEHRLRFVAGCRSYPVRCPEVDSAAIFSGNGIDPETHRRKRTERTIQTSHRIQVKFQSRIRWEQRLQGGYCVCRRKDKWKLAVGMKPVL